MRLVEGVGEMLVVFLGLWMKEFLILAWQQWMLCGASLRFCRCRLLSRIQRTRDPPWERRQLLVLNGLPCYVDSLLGLLIQLGPVFLQDMVGVVVRGEEAHIVDLGPALLLLAQYMGVPPKERMESLGSQ